MAPILLAMLILPLLFVVWDLVVARPKRAEAAPAARHPSAATATAAAAGALRADARAPAAPRRTTAISGASAITGVTAPAQRAPRRGGEQAGRQTELSPEHAQIIAALSAAYPAPSEG